MARLQRRVEILATFLQVLLWLFRILKPNLAHVRVEAADKARLLRAVHRSRSVPGLSRLLSRVGLFPSRLSSWRRAERACELADESSCPRFSPQRLAPTEIDRVRDLVTSPANRHVPTARLAILAQRLALVFASATTWHRLIRERGWRRPRVRVHPARPTEGIRAAKPNDIWHVDTTLLRLLDGTRVYLHAVIDNFSRRILAWHLADRFEPASTVKVLVEAGRGLDRPASPPMLLVDAGVENLNDDVDKLIASGALKRVLAQTELRFSNSMIEAWWRSLKHNWLFLNGVRSTDARREICRRGTRCEFEMRLESCRRRMHRPSTPRHRRGVMRDRRRRATQRVVENSYSKSKMSWRAAGRRNSGARKRGCTACSVGGVLVYWVRIDR